MATLPWIDKLYVSNIRFQTTGVAAKSTGIDFTKVCDPWGLCARPPSYPYAFYAPARTWYRIHSAAMIARFMVRLCSSSLMAITDIHALFPKLRMLHRSLISWLAMYPTDIFHILTLPYLIKLLVPPMIFAYTMSSPTPVAALIHNSNIFLLFESGLPVHMVLNSDDTVSTVMLISALRRRLLKRLHH